jgi:hypothetical protein
VALVPPASDSQPYGSDDIAGRLVKPTGSASGFKIAVMLRNADMRPSFA